MFVGPLAQKIGLRRVPALAFLKPLPFVRRCRRRLVEQELSNGLVVRR